MESEDITNTMTVIELARLAGATPGAIRYYVRKGLLHPKKRHSNNYKQFSPTDIKRVRFIRLAKQLGFSLKEIGMILQDSAQGRSPCPRVRQIIQDRIDENRRRLNAILSLQRGMEAVLERWQEMPDRLPDEDSICHLIESESLRNEDQGT